MRVAILTKFIGPTNYRSSRIKAYTETGLQVVVPWQYELNVEDNHVFAAYALVSKMGWDGKWAGGGTKEGYAFVNHS